jgi:hypothetical protein
MSLATPFAFDQRLCWRKVYLETIEGAGLLFSVRCPLKDGWPWRCVRPGIDFQLGTNAADTNGSNSWREGRWLKNIQAGPCVDVGIGRVAQDPTVLGCVHATHAARKARGLSPGFTARCAKKAQRYNPFGCYLCTLAAPLVTVLSCRNNPGWVPVSKI